MTSPSEEVLMNRTSGIVKSPPARLPACRRSSAQPWIPLEKRARLGKNGSLRAVDHACSNRTFNDFSPTLKTRPPLIGDVINQAYVHKNLPGIIMLALVTAVIFMIKGMATYGQAVALARIGNR